MELCSSAFRFVQCFRKQSQEINVLDFVYYPFCNTVFTVSESHFWFCFDLRQTGSEWTSYVCLMRDVRNNHTRAEWKQSRFCVLKRAEPLLCNDREMGGYTRAVSEQRLCKHVPVAR
jgi:hypothetical protein